jgi:hypothetical protein
VPNPVLPVAASVIPLLNFRHHVPEVLDLQESIYASWSSLFEPGFTLLVVTGPVTAVTGLDRFR